MDVTLDLGVLIWLILTAVLIGAVGIIVLIAIMTHRDFRK